MWMRPRISECERLIEWEYLNEWRVIKWANLLWLNCILPNADIDRIRLDVTRLLKISHAHLRSSISDDGGRDSSLRMPFMVIIAAAVPLADGLRLPAVVAAVTTTIYRQLRVSLWIVIIVQVINFMFHWVSLIFCVWITGDLTRFFAVVS